MFARLALLAGALFLLAGFMSASDVPHAPAASTHPPALCRVDAQGGEPTYGTICGAVITRGVAFAAARTQPGGTLMLTADYCGQAATGYDLGATVTADAGGYYTWSWQAPVPLSIQCSSTTISISMTDSTGHTDTSSASYAIRD
jgi:hypothetical protein